MEQVEQRQSRAFQTWGDPGNPDAMFFREGGNYRIVFPGTGEFQIQHDGLWTCLPDSSEAQARCQVVFEQQVQPLLLSLRGEQVFHGGAIAIGDVSIAFLAPSGRGKSTLTAGFARRRHPFLSDDCLHLDMSSQRVHVHPHADHVRLWEDSAAELGGGLAAFVPGSTKSRLQAGERLPHCDRSLPLARVYVLGESDATSIEPMSPSEQLIGWTANAFVLDIKNPQVLKRNLQAAARLVREVPMRRLDYPRRYETLDEVVDAVLADAAG